MKTMCVAMTSFMALVSLAPAAPRLVVSTPSLTPESQLDLILDFPAIDTQDVGKTVDNTWLDIAPALPGKLLWKAPNIAQFVPAQAPAIGAKYTFSIPQKKRYLDQTPVKPGPIVTLDAEPFKIIVASAPNRWATDYSPSTAGWIMAFNDDVDPNAAAAFISFESKAGQRIAAILERATYGTAGYLGSSYRSWNARFPTTTPPPAVTPETSTTNILVVKPISPLPAGEGWTVSVLKGLPNQSAIARIVDDMSYDIGKIEPFKATGISAVVNPDEPRRIDIEFNQSVPDPLPADFVEKCLSIAPMPADLQATAEGREIHLTATFDEDHYQVSVKPPFRSKDGLDLSDVLRKDTEFQHLDPELLLTSDSQAQLAGGSRTYRVLTINLKSIHIRVKKLSGGSIIRTSQGYRNYQGIGHDGEEIQPSAPVPYSMIDGEVLFDKEMELENGVDTSKEVTLKWDEILPAGAKTATLFVDIVGQPNPDCGKEGRRNVQSLVQLTDIGLAWKLTGKQATLYAFSCDTGTPLPNVKLQLFGEDATPLDVATTNASGLAELPRKDEVRHLQATVGNDGFLTAFDATLDTVGTWHFPVRYSWSKAQETTRRAFLFTDRSLYRPGETVRLKGIVRNQRGNAIEAPRAGNTRVVIIDPAEQELVSSEVKVSESGSFDFSYKLPEGKTGEHLIRFEYPDELKEAEGLEDEYDKQEAMVESARFEIALRVEEFRRNAFEVNQTIPTPAVGAKKISSEVVAKYYQGQPVAAGKVKHFTRVSATNLYPERFRDFLFGNHRMDDWSYWYHYFGYRSDDEETGSYGQVSQFQGDAVLSEDGKATIEYDMPESDFPMARDVSISTEVTDSNNQTLTSTAETVVHPASVYVGVSRCDQLIRAGDVVPLKLVAADVNGEPFAGAVKVTATLTREINTPVKSRTDDGSTTTRNDVTEETVSTTEVAIEPTASAHEGTPMSIQPKETGLHFLTLKGVDPDGRAFQTVTHFNVYGTKEYPWAYEDGLRIKLVAEKKSYKPGDTARILVLSPIEGTALVTIEREKVLRSFMVELKSTSPVVEVPVGEDDAPNAFVSVLIVKGAKESAREHKEPQLRLGYCELIVEDLRDRLAIEMKPTAPDSGVMTIATKTEKAAPSFRPGEEITLTGTVKLADGNPAAGAEVTFYAEDEGTLAVMGYDTPQPMDDFYKPRTLDVETGTSFETFLSEDPDSQEFSNKGFFIGGGGDMSKLKDEMRKNFDPCGTWAAALIADGSGKFTHTFTLPDTLTRYRLIAVAHHGTAKFGTAESALVVKKDLMLEPKAPRFANQGDTFNTQVLVQNASGQAGTWEVKFGTSGGNGTPCAGPIGPATQTITLEAGKSGSLVFPARADDTGEAVLTWEAVPVSLAKGNLTAGLKRSLSDSVEARFQVNYPMPLLRQSKLVNLGKANRTQDLREQLDRNLLDGNGSVDLEFSRSPLIEAAGSIDYLLHYPYGCVEQTTSSLIPWLAVEDLKPVIPRFAALSDEKVEAAIQAGADRLLSMQLADGSFAYWPGGTESVPWATPYAGMGLMLAKEQGANVPDSAIEKLTQHMIESLRGMATEKSTSQLETYARTLLVLSLGEQPQVAYQNKLADRIAELSPSARALLAAAIAVGAQEDPATIAKAKSILTSKAAFKAKNDEWMPWIPDDAFNLIAWSTIEPDGPEPAKALDRMLRDRNPYGHWRTTWVNGWSLLAMATFAQNEELSDEPAPVTLATSKGNETIALDPDHPTATRSFKIAPDLKLAATTAKGAYVRVNVASKPRIAPFQPVAHNGLSVDRIYEKVNADGTTAFLTEPQIGDLIRVTLRVTLPKDDTRYLVVEDYLPSVFETVNNDFKTQRAAIGMATSENDWSVSHSELRTDRASFFLDHVYRHGTYTVTYLARCTLGGQAMAPPAKVESMYDPENYALSASRNFAAR